MSVKTAPKLDPKKVESFMHQFMSDSAAAVRGGLNYIGDRLGIWKALSESGAVTAEQLAEKTGLKLRYLQEWLSAEAAGGYLEYDPAQKTFFLPPEHAAFLSDENSPYFSGGMMHMVVPLVSKAPEVGMAFRNGGGVCHNDHHHEVTEGIERFTQPFFVHFLTQEWIPLMPEVHEALKSGINVADIGCGAGLALIEMAKAYPNSKFFGYDDHIPSIERARVNARRVGLFDKIKFECEDVSKLKEGQFDLITTFDVIHDMVNPTGGLAAIRRLLAPNGTYVMLEMNAGDKLEDNLHPFGSMLYSVSTLYCMTVSLAEGGAGIGACMGEAKARELVQQAGFKQFRKLPIQNPFNLIYEVKH